MSQRYVPRDLVFVADQYLKKGPPISGVTTICGDLGIPHEVIDTPRGAITVRDKDWIVYSPVGVIVIEDRMFRVLYKEAPSYVEEEAPGADE